MTDFGEYGIVVDFIGGQHIRPATKEDLDKTLNSAAIGWDGAFEDPETGDVVCVVREGDDDKPDTIEDVIRRAQVRGWGDD
jgi:hypothetical protein